MRRKISVRLSDESARGWDRVCTAQGITMTAFIEAIGLDMADRGIVPSNQQGHDIIELARQIDRDRRTRR